MIRTMMMNPNTGSVATEIQWREDYEQIVRELRDCGLEGESFEEELCRTWGGLDFEDGGLVEVAQDEEGNWVEA